MLENYVRFINRKRGKLTVFLFITSLTFVFAWHLPTIEFDFEFEKFFPRNHPESTKYKKHVSQFGYDNDFLQIILENESGIFDSTFLNNAATFEYELKKTEDVENVYSILTLQHLVKSPTGLVVFPLIHLKKSDRLASDSIRITGNDFYKSAISSNGKAINMYLNHAHFDDPKRSEQLLTTIAKLAQKHDLNHIRMVGKLSASMDFIQYMKKDFGFFLGGSMILSFSLLLLIFKSFKSAILPFIISVLSIVWLLGFMSLLGYKINLLSSLIPPILFFVSMSNSVHFLNALSKFSGKHKKEKLVKALEVVFVPTLLTSLTTAVGFLSLLWIQTEPIQTLGLFTGIGVFFSFVITYTFGLLAASMVDLSKSKPTIGVSTSAIDLLFRKKKSVVFGMLVLFMVMAPGAFRLKINSFLLEDLPKASQVREDFEFSDRYLGGSKPYEIRVELADSTMSIWEKSVMDEIVKIEEYLTQEYPIANVQSPATVMRYLTMVNHGGLNENYRYPSSKVDYLSTMKLKDRIDPKRLTKLVTPDAKVARLVGFFPELGSYETDIRNKKLLNHLDSTIDSSIIKYAITGTTYLIDKSHMSLSKSLFYGLFTAIGIVGLILGVYFRSWKLVIISLIPNVLPLLLVAGMIGWLGISLKMTTSIIFAISFGIAVDDTIHMMSSYLSNKSSTPRDRIEATFKHAGSAVIITSIIMCGGFCIFLLSSFGATFYLGLFITLSLLVALLIDLTILPILLTRFIDGD